MFRTMLSSRKCRTSDRFHADSAVLEALESRLLLTAELSATLAFDPASWQVGLVAGDRGCISYRVYNDGDTTASGAIRSNVYLSADATLDDSDILLATGVRTGLKIRAGRSSAFRTAVTLPSDLAQGSYYVIVDFDTTHVFGADFPVASDEAKDTALVFGTYHGRHITLNLTDSSSGEDVAVTFSIWGKGYGVVAANSTPDSPGYDITLKGTDGNSKVWISTDSGQYTNLNSVWASGSLKSFEADTANLVGDFEVKGSVAYVSLADVGQSGQPDVTIELDSLSRRWVDLNLGSLTNVTIESSQPIGNLYASQWLDDAGGKDSVRAPILDDLYVGDDDSGLAGDFQADVTVHANKYWDDDEVYIGRFHVDGTVSDSTIRSEGDIDHISVGAAINSNFLAGVQDDVTQPSELDDFRTHRTTRWYYFLTYWPKRAYSRIDSVDVNGVDSDPDASAFVNSNIAAGSIGHVTLTNVQFDNGGDRFGLFAARANTYGHDDHAIDSVKLVDTASDSTDWLNHHDFPYTDQDFVIRVM